MRPAERLAGERRRFHRVSRDAGGRFPAGPVRGYRPARGAGCHHLRGRAVTAHAEKILLVDDADHELSALGGRLSGRFAIETASGPAEALRMLEASGGIAGVVLDMDMAEMSAAALLGEIRGRWPEIRCIILAGDADRESAVTAVDEGRAFRFVGKPADADHLAGALEAAIEEHRFTTDAEVQLQRLKMLAASGEQTRKSFLAMMTHELRTPLNHILGFSALLEQRCKQKGELDSLEYISYIRQSGQTLLRVIDRIMEVVRLTTAEIQMGEEVFDLTHALRQEVAHCRALAAERGITIGFAAPGEPLHVRASEHALAHAFAELLDNAIRFNRPGGHVSVAVNRASEDVAIRIADTGIGMSEVDVNRLLDAFCRRENGLGRRFEGVGIGLTLAVLTTQTYGGNLSIESRKDHGTVVVMRLKRAVEEPQAARIA
jgi:signal transduction histidine kinase